MQELKAVSCGTDIMHTLFQISARWGNILLEGVSGIQIFVKEA